VDPRPHERDGDDHERDDGEADDEDEERPAVAAQEPRSLAHSSVPLAASAAADRRPPLLAAMVRHDRPGRPRPSGPSPA
jgi:hypothetical protein